MLSSLDSFTQFIKIEPILHSPRIAKEETNSCIGNQLNRSTWSSRMSVHSTTKHEKKTQIWL
jgi:hypothetical protein